MRVLHLTNRFSKLSEQFIYEQLQGTARLGCDNHVLCRVRENESERPWPAVHEMKRMVFPRALIATARLLNDRAGAHREAVRWRAYQLAVAQVILRVRPGVVHAQFAHLGALAAPVARLLRVALVVHLRGFDYSVLPFREEWRESFEALWPRCSFAIPVANALVGDALRLGCREDSLIPIYNGKEAERIAYAPRPEAWEHRWCTIGRLVSKKGHDSVIRAIAHLREQGRPATLSIIGEGPDRKSLEALAVSLSVAKHVRFLGSQSWADAMTSLRQADALVLASRIGMDGDKEGLANVLVEAALTGRLVVTTRHAGNPEALAPCNRDDWTVPENDDLALAACMMRVDHLGTSERRRVVLENRKYAEEYFELGSQSLKLLSVYQRARQGMRHD